MEDTTPTIIGAYDWQASSVAKAPEAELATPTNTNRALSDAVNTPDPPEASDNSSAPPPETFPFFCDMMKDKRIWKQQYKSISRDIVGPPYKIDFSQAAFQHMRKTNKEDLERAFSAMETILRYGPYTDNHTTLVSHDTWLAMTFNLVRAATIGLMRASAYTSEEVMACIWDLEGPFPPPQYETSRDGRDVWQRMANLCFHLAGHIPLARDSEDLMENYKMQYEESLMTATRKKVDDFIAVWKEACIKKAQSDLESEIAEATKTNNKQLFMKAAQKLGLTVLDLDDAPAETHTPATPRGPANRAPSAPAPTPVPRRNPPRGARRSSQSERGSELLPAPGREPSPTPRPRTRKAAAPRLPAEAPALGESLTPGEGSAPTVEPTETEPPAPAESPALTKGPPLDATTLLVSLSAKLDSFSSKVESSLAGVLKRVETLERGRMPPPPPPQAKRGPPLAPQGSSQETCPAPAPAPSTVSPPASQSHQENGFVQVGRNGRAIRSYAGIAATPATPPAATSGQNATATTLPKRPNPLSAAPTLSEVTIVRRGGMLEPNEERAFRARPPDVIARSVIDTIRAAAPGHPAIPRSGRWGHHSKGNYIFTFNGQVTPEHIHQVETYLLRPFPDGELVINHGWSRIMLKMVPVYNAIDSPHGPIALEEEVRQAIPALAKKPFAQAPKWLLGPTRIQGQYSSVTFAFSDPDRSITKGILAKPVPMFGREVRAVEFIDRPPLVICGRCHLLGHQTGSQVCKVKPDQVRCAHCGGAHKTEEHAVNCKKARTHRIAGICDCNPFCLNCKGNGHISTDPTCPRRKDFYVRKKSRRPRNRRPVTLATETPAFDDIVHEFTEPTLFDTEPMLFDVPPDNLPPQEGIAPNNITETLIHG